MLTFVHIGQRKPIMHCHRPRSTPVPLETLVGPVAPGDRIGDADRDRAADLLGDAAAAGYLQLDELSERLAVVWSATTAAGLAAAEAGLPDGLRRDHARRAAHARAQAGARAGLVPHVATYVAVMVVLVVIWLAVGLAEGGWYPWPIWPALGWGIGVASHVRVAAATGDRS